MPPHLGHKKEIIEITLHTESDAHVFRFFCILDNINTHFQNKNEIFLYTDDSHKFKIVLLITYDNVLCSTFTLICY